MTTLVMDSIFAGCPPLRSLRSELVEQLAGISRIIEVAADAVLCRQGAPAEALHYLLDGQVTLSQACGNSESAVIDVVQPVSSVALASVVAGHPHLMTAQTVKPSRLLEMSAAPLRQLIATHPPLAVAMLQGLSAEVEATTRHVLDLKLRTAAQRLGCYLLSLAPPDGASSCEVILPYHKRLLAARLGCRHENLSRAFAVLREFGVDTRGSRVVLHDLAGLRRFAASDPALDVGLPTAALAFSQAFEL